jgi:hypothetical protein
MCRVCAVVFIRVYIETQHTRAIIRATGHTEKKETKNKVQTLIARAWNKRR